MDFRLTVFLKVADFLSFTKAAKELRISQPAVTKHIVELEKKYCKALFIRSKGKIQLTHDGVLFYQYAQRIVREYEELSNAFLVSDNKLPAEVILGASTTIAQYVLPRLICALKQKYPETRFRLLSGNTAEIEEMVMNNKVFLGFTEGTSNSYSIRYSPFVKDELVLVTRSENAMYEHGEISINELKKVPLLVREEGSGTRVIIEEALNNFGISSKQLLFEAELGATECIKNYLYHSNTFAFLSIHSIYKELLNSQLRIIEIQGLSLPRNFYFVQNHGVYNGLVEQLQNQLVYLYNKK